MSVFLSNGFEKMFKNCPQEIKNESIKRIDLLLKDRRNPKLNNHMLSVKLKGLRSINISGDWRIIFENVPDGILLIAIGTHSQLYK